MRIDSLEERKFYEIEAIDNNWSLREFRRQFDTSLYERLALSRDKKAIKELSEKEQIIEKVEDRLSKRELNLIFSKLDEGIILCFLSLRYGKRIIYKIIITL